MGTNSSQGVGGKLRRFGREHPYLAGWLVASTLAGAALGAWLPLGELSVVRSTLGGGVAGFYFGLFPLGSLLFD